MPQQIHIKPAASCAGGARCTREPICVCSLYDANRFCGTGVNALKERIRRKADVHERLTRVEESLDSAIRSTASGAIAVLCNAFKDEVAAFEREVATRSTVGGYSNGPPAMSTQRGSRNSRRSGSGGKRGRRG